MSPRTRPRQSLIASAHHESGHAVARAILRIAGDVDRMSIHPEDFDAGTLGMVWGRQAVAQDREAIRARVIGLLAGPAAESRYTGREKTGCGDDVEAAWALLAQADLDEPTTFAHAARQESDPIIWARAEVSRVFEELRRRFERLNREAEEFVEQRWDVIERVARRLARKGRLSGDEVRAIVAQGAA